MEPEGVNVGNITNMSDQGVDMGMETEPQRNTPSRNIRNDGSDGNKLCDNVGEPHGTVEPEKEQTHSTNVKETMKEITMRKLWEAIERLHIRLDSIDNTNTTLLRTLVGFAKGDATPSPPHLRPQWPFSDKSPTEEHVDNMETCKGKKINIDVEAEASKKRDVLRKLKDVTTILISDDEEDNRKKRTNQTPKGTFVRGKQQGTKPKPTMSRFQPCDASESETEQVKGKKAFCSNYRRGISGTVGSPNSPHSMSVRRLSFTPKGRANKRAKTDSKGVYGCNNNKDNSDKPSPSEKTSKGKKSGKSKGEVVPNNVQCMFRPSSNMKLSPTATNVCVYVFQALLEPSEVVFSVGNNVGTRSDFDCLCPGRKISRQIVLLMAVNITCNQLNNSHKSVWCLPPTFADDVSMGRSTDELVTFYGHDWMGCYEHLTLVYVPVEDNYGHWFLTVIVIEEKKIYLLDSNLPDCIVDSRRVNIRRISTALSRVIQIIYNGNTPTTRSFDFASFEIMHARGLSNCGNSANSGLWVLEWMNMENRFTSNVIGIMDDKMVRMEVAMRLLMSDHSECKKDLIERAAEYWLEVNASPTH